MLRCVLASLGWAACATLVAGAPVRDLPLKSHISNGPGSLAGLDWPCVLGIGADEGRPYSPKSFQHTRAAAKAFDNIAASHILIDIARPCVIDLVGLSEDVSQLLDESTFECRTIITRCGMASANVSQPSRRPDDLANRAEAFFCGRLRHMLHNPSGIDGSSGDDVCSAALRSDHAWTPRIVERGVGDCDYDEVPRMVPTTKSMFEITIRIQNTLSYLLTLMGREAPKKVPNLRSSFGRVDSSGDTVVPELLHRYRPCHKREIQFWAALLYRLRHPGRLNEQPPYAPLDRSDGPVGGGWSCDLLSEPRDRRAPLSGDRRPWYMRSPRRLRRHPPHLYPPLDAEVDVCFCGC